MMQLARLLLACVLVSLASAQWLNVNVLRTIDLTEAQVHETQALKIENTGKAALDTYDLVLAYDSNAVALVKAEQEDTKVSVRSLPDGHHYRIALTKPVAPGDQADLQVTVVVAGADVLERIPATIPQDGKQYLVYSGLRYVPSVYDTQKQRTKLRTRTIDVTNWTEYDAGQDPTRAGTVLTYGPYESIPAGKDSQDEIRVRYEWTGPLLRVTELQRDIEVSLLGNIAFEQRTWLMNDAAPLVGGTFDRFKWARHSMMAGGRLPTTAASRVDLHLGPGARDAYYVDDVGNVSTSNFRPSVRGPSLLSISPRYPLFGGWKYYFKVGWNVDASRYLRESRDGRQVLRLPLVEGSKNTLYDAVTVRVVLPEGAKDVKVELPVQPMAESMGIVRSYLDTIGRPYYEFRVHRIVDETALRDIYISYRVEWYETFRKPAVAASVLGLLYIGFYIVTRIDLSIKST